MRDPVIRDNLLKVVTALPSCWRQLRRHPSACGVVVVFLVAVAGILLAWQGWKSRTVLFDLVPHIVDAHALLVQGRLPDRGSLCSFASYTPPGTTWLLLPGVLAFDDPRLFEAVGSSLLYLGTLLGIFLLAWNAVGLRCALLSVGLYGLSELGLIVAGSLWPRGHPCFYVWMIYWTWRWIRRRQAIYLTAAFSTWAVGMYVYLEIAPAVFVLPMMWLVHRAPLKRGAVIAAAGLTLLIWAPYLRFEATRGFVDLTSQVLQQSILPTHFRQAWCDPELELREWGEPAPIPESTASPPSQPPASGWLSAGMRLLARGHAILGGVPYNFEHVLRVPGATLGTPVTIVVLLAAGSSLTLLSLSPSSTAWVLRFWRPWLLPLTIAVLGGSALANEFVLAPLLSAGGRLTVSAVEQLRLWQVGLGLSGLALCLPLWAHRMRQHHRSTPEARFLVLSLLIPWGILLCLAEPNPWPLGPEKRFWWLWPLQVIMLAASMTEILPRLSPSRLVTWTVPAVLMALVLANPPVLSSLDQWRRTGWAGPNVMQIQVIDYIAARLRAQGKKHATVGYQVFFDRFMAEYHVNNQHLKVGAEFDLLLQFRHGITNINQCAEGISPDDEYRIVQMHPSQRLAYFTIPPDSRFHLLQQFSPYQVVTQD